MLWVELLRKYSGFRKYDYKKQVPDDRYMLMKCFISYLLHRYVKF
jgi:hypothetical protein